MTILGVDIGGTFTDFVFVSGNSLQIHKLLTSAADPSIAFVRGVEEMGVPGDCAIVHGSTVATNAILERKGARTALITTRGFADVLEIGRQNRPSLYDLFARKPEPFVPRDLRFEVGERLDFRGQELVPLDYGDIEEVAVALAREAVQSVAVSFLFSYANPEHEQAALELLEEYLGKLSPPHRLSHVSLSSKVLPEYREFERTSTTVINAYVSPLVDRYMAKLEDKVGRRVRVMQSNGGSISASMAASMGVRTVLSGPAAGVIGAFHVAKAAGYDNIISFDMGGTSTDVSLCPGRLLLTSESQIGGFPLRTPVIDIHTVGAGGGSIARLRAGALAVGPESAGSDPGPACYGNGTEPTVTDANLILGRLDAHRFLGGRFALDEERAKRSFDSLASEMAGTIESAATGVIRVANANMENAIRRISVERGFDPRLFTLVAFGGAGPLHACDLASSLHIPRVLIPRYPGVLSALGMLAADIVWDSSRTVLLSAANVSAEGLNEVFASLRLDALNEMRQDYSSHAKARFEKEVDLRYVGQSYELTVPYTEQESDPLAASLRAFHELHERRYGHRHDSAPVELVNVRLRLVVEAEKPPLPRLPLTEGSSDEARIGEKSVFFDSLRQASVYDRERLRPGHVIRGPAVVFQLDSTVVVPLGWWGAIDEWLNIVLESF